MAVSIEAMLEALEELLEEGMSVPLSGGKRVVDIDEARDIIDDIRINILRHDLITCLHQFCQHNLRIHQVFGATEGHEAYFYFTSVHWLDIPFVNLYFKNAYAFLKVVPALVSTRVIPFSRSSARIASASA